MKSIFPLLVLFTTLLTLNWACKKDNPAASKMDLISCVSGDKELNSASETTDVPCDQDFIIRFSVAVDSNSVKNNIILRNNNNELVSSIYFRFADGYKTVIVKNYIDLTVNQKYTLLVAKSLKGSKGEIFSGTEFVFTTFSGVFVLNSITLNNQNFKSPLHVLDVPVQGSSFKLEFSEPVDTVSAKSKFTLSGNPIFNVSFSNSNKSILLQSTGTLQGYTKYTFAISSSLKSKSGFKYEGFSNWFISGLDSTLKFPLITDEELLSLVQKQTFKFFYDYAHPASGMARERTGSGDLVTIGGSGFGVMALIVGIERGFITRNEGITHLTKIIHFLETCDRFHGVWPHWIDGNTGKVIPFSPQDNGGDLVETSYMIQGLITLKQYLNEGSPVEADLKTRIINLCDAVEYDWFTQGQNALYWHWSPTVGFAINMMLRGYNETLIAYIVASSSTKHPISAAKYHQGYANNGGIINGNSYYGYKLPLGQSYGGPLFFTQYSFLGLNPKNLSDVYANYWEQNVNQSLINHEYCKTNPKKFAGYNDFSWGLTASDNPWGYEAHSPTNDLGVISPTAAVSAIAFTPVESMNAIRYFYYILGDKLWGNYGFYDAFDVSETWWADSYLAIDQGPEIVMIENYRSGLLWNLFMSAPEIQAGLNKLGFTYKK